MTVPAAPRLVPAVRRRLTATSTPVRAATRWWQERLGSVEPASALADLTGQPAPGGYGRYTVPVLLHPADSQRLTAIVAGVPSRLLAVLLVAGGLVTARYAGRDDLLVGTPALGPAPHRLLPVAMPHRSGMRVADALLAAERAVLQAVEASDGLTDSVPEVLGPDDAYALCVCAEPQARPVHVDAVCAGRIGTEATTVELDLRGDRIGPALAASLADHIGRALRSIVDGFERPLSDIEVIGDLERRQLLDFGDGGALPAVPDLLPERLIQYAHSQPDRPALVYRDRRLTWRDLYRAARAVADLLARHGIRRHDRVGMLLDRGDLPVVAALGAFLLGAVYVPLDTSLPDDRLQFMLSDSSIGVLMTEAACQHRAPAGFRGTTLVLSDPLALAATSGPERPGPRRDWPAYAIYTSGTTGKPKAVLITHDGYASTCLAYQRPYALTDGPPVALQLCSIAFDVFNGDLARSLYIGGTLVVSPDDLRTDATALADLVASEGVTILETTPGLIGLLAEALSEQPAALRSLRTLICSADALSWTDYHRVRGLLGGHVTLVNTYGVTEVSIDQTCYLPSSDGPVEGATGYTSIGVPMPGVNAFVLDSGTRLAPLGGFGELCFAGPALATGYLGRPGLTADRFVPNPFGIGGSRLYRTGDRTRFDTAGRLEFAGRLDEQVKLRGYRVELGEIEETLRGDPAVGGAAAIVHTNEVGVQRLMAYVTGDLALDQGVLRDRCAAALPEFMVPSLIIQIPEIPLTRNQKVDRRALAALPLPATTSGAAPRSATERMLADLWRQLLGVDEVGTEDDFFELGGHSLLALQLVNQVRKLTSRPTSVRDVFEQPTLVALAATLDRYETS